MRTIAEFPMTFLDNCLIKISNYLICVRSQTLSIVSSLLIVDLDLDDITKTINNSRHPSLDILEPTECRRLAFMFCLLRVTSGQSQFVT